MTVIENIRRSEYFFSTQTPSESRQHQGNLVTGLMASDVKESEAVLKGVSDTSLNNSNSDSVTPSRTDGDLGNRPSSGVSRKEGGQDFQDSSDSALENREKSRRDNVPKTRTTPGKVQKQSGGGSSAPVSLSKAHSPPRASGRCVFWGFI